TRGHNLFIYGPPHSPRDEHSLPTRRSCDLAQESIMNGQAALHRSPRAWALWLVMALLALSGCASTLSARVATYQQWPVGAQGEYYRIVPGQTQAGRLRFGDFSDRLRAGIGPRGRRGAVSRARHRFAEGV